MGKSRKPPILLLHGYMDTAATFTVLVEKLPDDYYYVGVDMPGHGKSDPFPPGILITKLHIVEVIRLVVKQLQWDTFTFLSHSMSGLMGIFYNTLYPGRIKNMILLDPKPALAWYYVIQNQTALWYKVIYNNYYENYERLNNGKTKSQSYESWIKAVSRTRNLTKEQSNAVLSRSFVPTGNNKFAMSWEQRVKHLAHIQLCDETLYELFSNLPPTLVITAAEYTEFVKVAGSKQYAEKILKDAEQNLPHFRNVTVTGHHDFHITNPELMVDCIVDFYKGMVHIL